MNTLIIGYGSVGQRHSRILQSLDCHVSIVSRHAAPSLLPTYRCEKDGLQAVNPDVVVVSNRTHEHFGTLCALREQGYKGVVLMEKPLFDGARTLPPEYLHNVFVAYNLRFHPVLNRLKSLVKQDRVVSTQVYVGQYLPIWRQGDYRLCYSAKRQEGGGALRDLSHELDYVQWLFGKWRQVTALGGHCSNLEIDSDDVCGILMKTNQCPVLNIQMNYLDRLGRRQILVNTDAHTYVADLMHNTLQVDRDVKEYPCTPDLTYRKQLQALILGQYNELCSAKEALAIVDLIEEVEQCMQRRRWVTR
ncbi:Gfo/Idh/MocA family oxidoreductase [Alicyclobacillus fastidiosus]|uniref:Gfo/Idh/MocA family oxidoreductase n=1 Tax=Alicyclobacillus fastidiosus TaxID=392011 RepID=A0ABY6ZB61_9BACL|nr:Gfo/Idh/MocA family oxidoreductase [Alicyclobacillus fastidiosus]WAH39768.1 Gfo/Idh/MocA family oxidoreductase [Alicyclobacillus fastidiosus]GMA61010.1 hypothetical protein GCM10025859_14500 [Alicyclobacillus fastidiosus]